MLKYQLLLLLLNSLTAAVSQVKTASIAGIIRSTDGTPISRATVRIKQINQGVYSLKDGSFIIKDIAAGDHVVEVSMVGYVAITRNVRIESVEQVFINVSMQPDAVQLKKIEVLSSKIHKSACSSSIPSQKDILLVPRNIQTVLENTIREQQAYDLSENIVRNVSGASLSADENWGNYANIMMRGTTVTAFRNGINVKTPWGPLLEDMAIVERIEFIKGPAVFLSSHGEPSGSYNVITKKPSGNSRGEFFVAGGSNAMYRTGVDVEGEALRGDLLYRLNFSGQQNRFHRDYDFRKRYLLAPVIVFKPSGKTTITAEYTYQHFKCAVLGAAYVFANKMGELPRHFSNLESNLEPSSISEHSAFASAEHKIDSVWRINTTLGYMQYLQTASTIWPAHPEGLQTNGNLTRSIANWDACSRSALGKFLATGGMQSGKWIHRLNVGIDISSKNYYADFYQQISIPGYHPEGDFVDFNIYQPLHGPLAAKYLPVFNRSTPLKDRAGGVINERSVGMFAQDEMTLTKKIRLTSGARFTHIRVSSFGAVSDNAKVSPAFGLNISAGRTTSIYASYQKSFIAQQGADSANKPFTPVLAASFEAGFKKHWFNRQWISVMSIYKIVKNNVVNFQPGNSNLAMQSGQIRTYGVELDVHGEISPHVRIIFNYAFTRGKITRDVNPLQIGKPVPGPAFPGHICNGWFTYHFPSTPLKGVTVASGFQYMGKRGHSMPDYFRIDTRLSKQIKRLMISVNTNNLFNSYLYKGAPFEFNNDPLTTEYYYIAEPGIQFRVNATYSWR